jgi:lipoate---protein ligase
MPTESVSRKDTVSTITARSVYESHALLRSCGCPGEILQYRCAGPDRTGWAAETYSQLEILVSPLRSVATNLAIDDEMMLEAATQRRFTLRLWWGSGPTVVLGRSEKPEQVVCPAACERLGLKLLHRRTGGGTVLQDVAVLNYSLTAPVVRPLDVTSVFGIGSKLLVGTLGRLGLCAQHRGTSDVAIGDRKISGNAQSWRRGAVLLQGTLLHDIDMDLLEACLSHPPREPDYRQGRSHRDFLTTLVVEGVCVTPPRLEATICEVAQDLKAAYSIRPAQEEK